MPLAQLSDSEIYYETMGRADATPLVLVMGFTAPMTFWPGGFCQQLVDHGFFVIRLDNRDCGLSSKTPGDAPSTPELVMRAVAGEDVSAEVPYSLSDMANDVIGVMDTLGIDSAHMAGASMGGMIVQTVAIEHPDRIRTATSIMSTTGDPSVGQATGDAAKVLLAVPPTEREAAIAHAIEVSRAISGPLFDLDEATARIALAYDRANYPEGAPFQLAAMAASGDRTEALRSLDLPFLVLHGLADELIGVSGAHSTATAVPNADRMILARMGHDLPEVYWPQITGAIAGLATRA